MACCLQVLSRFVPSRFAPPRTATVPTTRLDSTNESSQFNARRDTVLQSTPDFVPNGRPNRLLRVECPGSRHSYEYLFNICEPLQGFEDCEIVTYVHRTTREVLQILRVEFDTQANATRGAGLLHINDLNGSPLRPTYLPDSTDPHSDEHLPEFEILPPSSTLTTMDEGAIHQPARKKAKLTIPIVCRICTNAITGPYSNPCLRCKKPWCPECVKTWFTMATKDFERMPARCCNVVMHHGVAGGTLSAAEYDMYKLRYDEHTTQNPLYCPVPTCSTFIPPRLMDPSQGTVNCTLCTTRICTKCKQIAATDHVCEEEVAATQIKAFNYKICPKCGTGVMKMYGCPHVRCACGAHFCFDCLRSLNVCYRSPCASAIEDGQYGDEEDEDVSDSDEDAQDTGTIAETTSDNQHAEPVATRTAQVESAGTRNTVQAVLNVFRGRRQRGAHLEERRRVLESVIQLESPSIERETTSQSSSVPIPAAESSFSLETSTPGTSTTAVLASTTPSNEASQLDVTNATDPDPSEARETGDLLTGQLPETPAPQTDNAVPAPTHPAETPALTRPSSVAAEPLAAALPFAQSSNTDLHESDFSTRPNPVIILSNPLTEPATPNLDDPNLLNWEAEDYDFGEEPIDEAFDVWGCACNFTKLKKDAIDEHWMDLKYLDCMKCFREVALHTTPQVLEGGGGGVKRFKERLAWHCAKCGVVFCGQCVREKKAVMKGLMRANGREGV